MTKATRVCKAKKVIPGVKGDDGDQGEKGDQGLQGLQGDKGDTGDTGEQGPPVEGGGVMPYEPYNHHILLSEWPLTDKWVFYTQFIAPANGDYTNITFFTTPSSTPTYKRNPGGGHLQ